MAILDKSDLKGFYMAVGTSGNQYKNAPVVGRMMAELIDACEKGLDHDKEPFQFTMKYTGRKLDRAIILLLLVAVAYFAADKFLPGREPAPGGSDRRSILSG